MTYTAFISLVRFKHGGRGWNNPFKKREGERLVRGNRGDLKTPEQVCACSVNAMLHRLCDRSASSGARLASGAG